MYLSPEVGDSVALDMVTTMATKIRSDGDDMPAGAALPILMGMEVSVENVSDDEIELAFSYDKVETDDVTMQGALDSMVGLSGSVTTTRNGAFIDGGVDTSGLDPVFAGTLDQFDQMLADMTVPLPVEPVGVNAEWEMTSSVEVSDLTFCNSATYRLIEFDGDAYELEVEVSSQILPTTMDEGGVSMTLKEGSSTGTGGSAGRLSLPIATSGTSSGSTTTTMEMEYDGEKHTQEITLDVDVEISLRDGEG
jgi:hypothetical protein